MTMMRIIMGTRLIGWSLKYHSLLILLDLLNAPKMKMAIAMDFMTIGLNGLNVNQPVANIKCYH